MNFGLIADGNRRWAKAHQCPIKEGHFNGFLSIRNEIIPVLQDDPDFTSLTVYGFSTENWKRNPLEVKNLMTLFSEIFDGWVKDLEQKKIRLIHAGRKDRLPAKLLEKIQNAESVSKNFKNFTIYLCLDYGGQDEIIRTMQKMDSKHSKLTVKQFEKSLEVPPLDIVLRSGGENRISNFCIWQCAYAEFFFLKKCLPDIKKDDIHACLKNFKNRDRRKGH